MADYCCNCGEKIGIWADALTIGKKAGRDADAYLCPKCSSLIKDDYFKMYTAESPEETKAIIDKIAETSKKHFNEETLAVLENRFSVVMKARFDEEFSVVSGRPAPSDGDVGKRTNPPVSSAPNPGYFVSNMNFSSTNQNSDRLFGNPGQKIKSVAKTFFWIEVIVEAVSLVIGLFILLFGDIEMFFLSLLASPFALAAGAFVAWLIALLVYGFGELVDNSTRTREKIEELNQEK